MDNSILRKYIINVLNVDKERIDINYYTCIKRIRRAENKISRYMLQYYGVNNKTPKFNKMNFAIGK
ncbi:hypothetical protein [Clostridium hydrogenum]|uniref:hypothetical protein n=1 Tax=Clostridium hydrogenum TaxID=2855764 RepID=UPI001F2B6263|nr:hypothetical protein [Clostridium hydrogenum]